MFYSILRAPPYDMQVDDDGRGCASVMVAVASDEDRIVSMACELTETDGICVDTCWEFSFSVEVVSLDDSSEAFSTQDRYIAAKYIPTEIRASMMKVVCAGLETLLNHRNPPLIYWVTKDRDMPAKALTKYHLLRETAQKLGYTPSDEGTDPFGRCFWSMRRDTD